MKKYHAFGSEKKLNELTSVLKGKGISVEREKENKFHYNETPKISFSLSPKMTGLKIFKKLKLRPCCSEV